MTPQEAETIYFEFGACLEHKHLGDPDKWGPHLQWVSRAELRKAIFLYLAKERYNGVDILHRNRLPGGQYVATLEIADQILQATMLFNPGNKGIPMVESSDETGAFCVLHDNFIKFLLELDRKDPEYWNMVRAFLA